MDALSIDRRGPFTTAGHVADRALDAALFRDLASDPASESARWVLGGLGARFTSRQLDERLHELEGQQDTRRDVPDTVSGFIERASRCYAIEFPTLVSVGGTRAHSVVRGRVQRHRGRPVRAFRRRRRRRHLLRHLHGVRRRGDPPAAARDDGLPEVHVLAPPRSRRREQRPRALPPGDRRRLLRVVPSRRRSQLRRPIRRHAPLADRCSARRSPIASGTASRSATADRRSSSTRDGWS